jgi:hypothetical protein
MNEAMNPEFKEWLREIRIEKIERMLSQNTINTYFEDFEL